MCLFFPYQPKAPQQPHSFSRVNRLHFKQLVVADLDMRYSSSSLVSFILFLFFLSSIHRFTVRTVLACSAFERSIGRRFSSCFTLDAQSLVCSTPSPTDVGFDTYHQSTQYCIVCNVSVGDRGLAARHTPTGWAEIGVITRPTGSRNHDRVRTEQKSNICCIGPSIHRIDAY